MKPKEIKPRPFVSWLLLLGTAIYFPQMLRALYRLSAIPFGFHPLWFAFYLSGLLVEIYFFAYIAISCPASIWRSRRPITVDDGGIHVGKPGKKSESLRWNELSELRRVWINGGLDVSDFAANVRLRLPYSWMFLNDFLPALDEQMRRCGKPDPSVTEISLIPGWETRTIVYSAMVYILFMAYAGLVAHNWWIVTSFMLLAAPIFWLSQFLTRAQGLRCILTADGNAVEIRSWRGHRLLTLTSVAQLQLSNVGLLPFIQIRCAGGSDVSIPLTASRNLLWYRTLIARWERAKVRPTRDAAV